MCRAVTFVDGKCFTKLRDGIWTQEVAFSWLTKCLFFISEVSKNTLHVVGRSPGHTAEGCQPVAGLGWVWPGPLASRKVRKQKAASRQHLKYLSYLCWFSSQVHKRWLRFLPFWASASSVRPSLLTQSPPSGSSTSASPAAPHRARLPCTNVRGRL